VTARGIERRAIFEDRREHEHFLELLGAMTERYGVEVHAYALMGNHYHLLIRTPAANASRAVQWLNVSYSVWFNKRRKRAGHVFQGRFGSVLVDGDGSWALGASAYVHLNPVRVSSLGLGKAANRAESLGLTAPDRALLRQRLKVLRAFRWSSFRAYAGYTRLPAWLQTAELLRRAGGAKAYRRFVQQHVTRGQEPEGFETLAGRIMLGSKEFQERARKWVGRVTGEQPARRRLARLVPVAAIVKTVERRRGDAWNEFAGRHGDWGRDLVLYLARKRSGLTLTAIGVATGDLPYKTVSKAVQRFEQRLLHEPDVRRITDQCLADVSNVET
jgi:REP element-mobilizing transposase RayT